VKIDIFNHVMPARYLELMKQHSKDAGLVKRMSNLRLLWDVEARVAMLREQFPDVQQVLTLSLPPPEALGGPDLAPELARVANDGMVEMCRRWPDRFPAFVASLPMNNVPAAAAEMDRAIGELGARGIQICTNVAGRPLDEPGEASRRADLDASGAAGVVRRLPHRAEIEVRDLAGPRLAVRDERCDGAHRVLGPFRATAGDAPHHPSLRRDDPVLRGACRNAVGTARLALRRR
jgi:hypothetical protein